MNVDNIGLIKQILGLIDFDLQEGPFLGGSYVTFCMESTFRNPLWFPNDVDIICRSISQLQYIDKKIGRIVPKVNEKNFEETTYYYWQNSIINIHGILHDVNGVERIKFADYTVSAFVSDNVNFLCHQNAIKDCHDSKLNLVKKTKAFIGSEIIMKDDPKTNALERYHKYLNRGYKDVDGDILRQLNEYFVK